MKIFLKLLIIYMLLHDGNARSEEPNLSVSATYSRASGSSVELDLSLSKIENVVAWLYVRNSRADPKNREKAFKSILPGEDVDGILRFLNDTKIRSHFANLRVDPMPDGSVMRFLLTQGGLSIAMESQVVFLANGSPDEKEMGLIMTELLTKVEGGELALPLK